MAERRDDRGGHGGFRGGRGGRGPGAGGRGPGSGDRGQGADDRGYGPGGGGSAGRGGFRGGTGGFRGGAGGGGGYAGGPRGFGGDRPGGRRDAGDGWRGDDRGPWRPGRRDDVPRQSPQEGGEPFRRGGRPGRPPGEGRGEAPYGPGSGSRGPWQGGPGARGPDDRGRGDREGGERGAAGGRPPWRAPTGPHRPGTGFGGVPGEDAGGARDRQPREERGRPFRDRASEREPRGGEPWRERRGWPAGEERGREANGWQGVGRGGAAPERGAWRRQPPDRGRDAGGWPGASGGGGRREGYGRSERDRERAGGGRPPWQPSRREERPGAPEAGSAGLEASSELVAEAERTLVSPGEELVAGRRPVEEAFAARREAHRLLVVPQRRDALEALVLQATRLRIPVVEVEGGTLTAIAGFDGHQGVALVVAPRRWASLDDVLARAAALGEPPLVLALDSLEDPQNLGTLLRSADACGVHGVIFPTRNAAPLTPAAVKASAGAVEHLLLVPVDDLPGSLADLRARGLRLVGTDADAALAYRDADLRGPVALVIGSEGKGMAGPVRRRLDLLVRIPMRGRVASLNAAVAGSVLLFEAAAQRPATPVLPEEGERKGGEESAASATAPARPARTVRKARKPTAGHDEAASLPDAGTAAADAGAAAAEPSPAQEEDSPADLRLDAPGVGMDAGTDVGTAPAPVADDAPGDTGQAPESSTAHAGVTGDPDGRDARGATRTRTVRRPRARPSRPSTGAPADSDSPDAALDAGELDAGEAGGPADGRSGPDEELLPER